MAATTTQGDPALDPAPVWWIAPDTTDWLAWGAIIALALAGFAVMSIYAKFDKWAEHKAEGTPLAKTIPTLLTIALLYEIFPLDHFHILLPISAILLAVMADWMNVRSGTVEEGRHGSGTDSVASKPEAGASKAEGSAQ